MSIDRALARLIVDKAWNECTESEEVPSTEWADRIIDAAIEEFEHQTSAGLAK